MSSDNSRFVHLHVHSCYSLLQGASTPEQIVDEAIGQGNTAVALTDLSSCGGLYEFSDLCLKKKIKPILGLEVTFCEDMSVKEGDPPKDAQLVLLAKNSVGWQNLCILASESFVSGYYYAPRIDAKILEKYREGLIVLTGGTRGVVNNYLTYLKEAEAKELLQWLQRHFGSDVYVEVMFHPSFDKIAAENAERASSDAMIRLADNFGIKCVFTTDVWYAKPAGWEVQDIMHCIKQHHRCIKDTGRNNLVSHDHYMRSREQVEKLFPGRVDFFDNTVEVAEKIESGLIKKGMDLLPEFVPPNKLEPLEYLRQLAYEGLKAKGLFEKPGYKEQADYELRVFKTCGFVNYFLVLNDFVTWARNAGIAMGPGRGSAVGSLCLYALDVCKMDPIKYELLFERFFSVDTVYFVEPRAFGLTADTQGIEVGPALQHKLLDICKRHPEFSQQKFTDEGKRMKQMKCLDEFLRIFVVFSKQEMVPGEVNENNSILAYYAGMTTKRPEGPFNPRDELLVGRVSPPDVDLDFDDRRREEVFGYLRSRYGENFAVQIGTFSVFKGKMIIKDVGKVLDVGKDWETNIRIKKNAEEARLKGEKPEEKEKSKNTLFQVDQNAACAEQNLSFKEAWDASPELQRHITSSSDYYRICCGFDGLVRHMGVHAAGVVLSKRPIREVMPLMIARKQSGEDDGASQVIATQWDKDQVEELGLYKYDLLGLINISIIHEALRLIKLHRGVDIDIDHLEPNDPEVFKILNAGHTKGVFQFEGEGATRLLAEVGVESFGDMVAVNAINRPGPLKAGVGKMYADRKNGRAPIKYLHPSMETALKDTYGTIVYQEQVMKLSRVMANFTTGEADKLRKAIGKKKQDLLEIMRDKFVAGCMVNGIDKGLAIEVWQLIDFFGGYGFNKCLSGETLVLNKKDGQFFSLEQLACNLPESGVVLDSYKDGEIVEDEMVEVFSTGEKPVYEVEMDNGCVIKCTLDHKFYCSDGRSHTVQEIVDLDLEIIYDERGDSDNVKIQWICS